MDTETRQRLEAAGFVETSVDELFGLTPEEAQLVELKVRLSRLMRQRRLENGSDQQEIAAKVGTSQSRISAIEKIGRSKRNVPEVSVDMMLKTLFSMGASHQEIALAISGK